MARIDETERVFDVSKPSRSSPSATSKPVIVAHRPTLSDPMVTADETAATATAAKVTSVPVFSDDDKPEHVELATPEPAVQPEPAQGETFEPSASPVEAPEKPAAAEEEKGFGTLHSIFGDEQEDKKTEIKQIPDSNGDGNITGHAPLPHPPGAGPKHPIKKYLVWTAGLLLVAFIGVYLALDAKLIDNNVKLPVSFFGKDSEHEDHDNISSPPPSPQASTAKELTVKSLTKFEPTADWTAYEIKTVGVKFSYPKDWKTTPKSEFGLEQFTMDSPDFKTVASGIDNPQSYIAEGGQFYVSVQKTTETAIDFLKKENKYHFTAENLVTIDGMQGVLGSCSHVNPGTCAYVLHEGNFYEFSYYQPKADFVKTKTGKDPVTAKDKYMQDYLKFLSSVDLMSH